MASIEFQIESEQAPFVTRREEEISRLNGLDAREKWQRPKIMINRIGAMVVDIRPAAGTAVSLENFFWA